MRDKMHLYYSPVGEIQEERFKVIGQIGSDLNFFKKLYAFGTKHVYLHYTAISEG